ncbi:LemA family protein [Neptunomonas antarctica]|uniref:LemA protein n=1 Tax=Neptunomonas antarctica TaxID=619304 RepID=A0A1N7NQJ0_9GAMM|nr:LemA family protein [Neptunomonas antarctica]SIT00498.1 LemA protein [Neptunomonas antarctica]
MITLSITAALIVACALYVISLYNGLVDKKTRAEEAWSGIEVQLKRRHNLIPNLIETVKGYASHEQQTFEKVVNARNNAIKTGQSSTASTAQAETVLSGALRQLFALAEDYPDLKANTNFLDLQEQLKELEDHIQMARRFYNGSTRDLNIMVDSFPSNLVAQRFSFNRFDFFELDEIESADVKKAPVVRF